MNVMDVVGGILISVVFWRVMNLTVLTCKCKSEQLQIQ